MRFIVVFAALIVLATGPALPQALPDPIGGPADPSEETFARNPEYEQEAILACEDPRIGSLSDDVLALVVVIGPPHRSRIVQEVWNVGVADLELLIVDGFNARAGSGVCIETAFPVATPLHGGLEIHYPSTERGGLGPLVLGFDHLATGACAAFCTGCGTYCHPGYEPTVSDLIGSVYEAVFASDERGRGVLELCETYLARVGEPEEAPCEPGEGIAVVRRTYPR